MSNTFDTTITIPIENYMRCKECEESHPLSAWIACRSCPKCGSRSASVMVIEAVTFPQPK